MAGLDGDGGYRGNQPRSTQELLDWLGGEAAASALEPELPIVDPHHHLFGSRADRLFYQMEDLRQDLGSGHRVIGTVYVEAYDSGWRTAGPEALRPVGEVEWIARATREAVPLGPEVCHVAAGIVCHADLALGDAVEDVLRAQSEAGQGRLRGVRQRSATVDGIVGQYSPNARKANLLTDYDFRRGFARLQAFGLSFDAWVYHPQMDELIDLADAFPETPIIVNHMAGPIGVAEFRPKRTEVLRGWREKLHVLAARQNVVMKVGGMGMPLLGLGFERSERPPAAPELAQAWRPYVDACIEAFGTKRCMFESNFPVDKQSCSYRSLWNAFKLITQGWSTDERRDVFYGTACRAYALPELASHADRISAGRSIPSGFVQPAIHKAE